MIFLTYYNGNALCDQNEYQEEMPWGRKRRCGGAEGTGQQEIEGKNITKKSLAYTVHESAGRGAQHETGKGQTTQILVIKLRALTLFLKTMKCQWGIFK